MSIEISGNITNFIKQFGVFNSEERNKGRIEKEIIYRTNTGIYNFLKGIPSDRVFIYFLTGFLLFNFLLKLNITPQNFIILLITMVIIFIYYDRDKTVNLNNMQIIDLKLSKIFPQPKYFYIDVGLIEIFYSIQDLRQYNSIDYDDTIFSIDEFLKMYYNTRVAKIPNYSERYDILKDLRKKILNRMHSLIYSIDDRGLTKKLKKSIDSIHLILNYYINQIKIINNNDIKNNGFKYNIREIELEDYIKPLNSEKFDLYT